MDAMSRTFVRACTRTRTAAALLAAALGLLAPLSACSDSTNASTGSVSLLLTDAPGDFTHAVVTISQIYLQGSSGRVVLLDTAVTTDLLTLANSTAALVQDAVVPAGKYNELRFVVTGGYIEVENPDGSTSIYASSPTYAGLPDGAQVTGPLQLPSYAQTGIKVTMPGNALTVSGDQKILLVDFDVSQSFGQLAGGSGMWVMSPVIKGGDIQTSGGLTVSLALDAGVTLPTIDTTQVTLADFHAVLTGPDTSTSTKDVAFAAGDGGAFTVQFPYLAPGTYSLDITGPSGVTFTTSPAHPATVTITSGGSASQDFTITAASAAQ
jgi:hypothetical protein